MTIIIFTVADTGFSWSLFPLRTAAFPGTAGPLFPIHPKGKPFHLPAPTVLDKHLQKRIKDLTLFLRTGCGKFDQLVFTDAIRGRFPEFFQVNPLI